MGIVSRVTSLFTDLAVSDSIAILQNQRCWDVFKATTVQNLRSQADLSGFISLS